MIGIAKDCRVLLAVFLSTGISLGASAWCHDGGVVAACDVVGITGDNASSRGLQFNVQQNFASMEVRMNPSVNGTYSFTAQLRRSTGFDASVIASVPVSQNLASTSLPYTTVHIDFPLIAVSGPATFTLKFVNITGPGTLFMETSGIGNFPCPDIVVTESNTGSYAIPRASASGMRILAPPDTGCPGAGCPGDLNGDRVVNLEDLAIVAANWLRRCAPAQLPVLTLKGNAINPQLAENLGEIFQIDPKGLIAEDGVIRYTNAERFQAVPTKAIGREYSAEDRQEISIEAIDFDAITGEVPDGKTAAGMIAEALTASGFNWPRSLQVVPKIDHTMFQTVGVDGKRLSEKPLDTHVDYAFTQGEIPVIGPGAKVKFVLDGERHLTHMTMGLPAVQSEGQMLPLISQQEADSLAMQAYALPRNANVHLTSQVVYWVPAGASQASALVPQFLYGGTMRNPQTNDDIQLRQILVPAVSKQTAPELIPDVYLYVDPGGSTIYASTEIGGGTPPFSYSWSSSTSDLGGQTGPSVQYTLMLREGLPAPQVEILTVVVTDAAGVSASATETIPLEKLSIAASPPPTKVGGVIDVGTEWVGTSQGLGGSAGNAGGFVTRFLLSGTLVRFNWGDYNAWERDFKDPTIAGGDDTNWIDNVDAAFYTGHANGDGFTFPSAMNDGFLHYNEARWGNNDLEWLVIAACGPLQLNSGGKSWAQRWGPAFQGLHILCAYQTVSNDNTVEGSKFANYLLSGVTVRQAWINTAIEVQPASVRFGVMGVFGKDGTSNMNDHFWGRGSVGPDIRGTNIVGYWLIHGPC